ncbi:transketolase [Bacterioplanoides sp.]|uniref:transketolase n=1 Tax=Bacterioplanoides sp. TaxID=2066072 RepID=UPI003B00E7B3
MEALAIAESAQAIRRKTIDVAYHCGESCHLGGSLSMVDVLAVLFGDVLNYDVANLSAPDRDIFILSKGHCVLGYYSTMNVYGLMSDETLSTFQQDGSHLIAHPVKNLELGIESSNGSLGQGLSFGLGMALGMRLKNEDRSVYVMMGDGECNEGSVWESAASAAEFGVGNLIAIVDVNGLRNDGQNFTYSPPVDLVKVWESFGWNVQVVDGHNHQELSAAFGNAKASEGKPSVILANTIKGKGVSFMEDNNDWHHNRITSKTYDQIKEEWGIA